MIELEEIRQRLAALRRNIDPPPKGVTSSLLAALNGVADDVERLLAEVEGLRASCRHSHLMEVASGDDESGVTYACITCHRRFHRGEPLPDDASGDIG